MPRIYKNGVQGWKAPSFRHGMQNPCNFRQMSFTQEERFRQFAGCRRVVWNWALARRIEHFQQTGKSLSFEEQCKELPLLKHQSCPVEPPPLKERPAKAVKTHEWAWDGCKRVRGPPQERLRAGLLLCKNLLTSDPGPFTVLD
jgi:hypothetical protein